MNAHTYTDRPPPAPFVFDRGTTQADTDTNSYVTRQMRGTKNYPLTCPDVVWEEFDATVDEGNLNDATVGALAYVVLEVRGDALDEETRREIEDYALEVPDGT